MAKKEAEKREAKKQKGPYIVALREGGGGGLGVRDHKVPSTESDRQQ